MGLSDNPYCHLAESRICRLVFSNYIIAWTDTFKIDGKESKNTDEGLAKI
jgi:hypothetical protein